MTETSSNRPHVPRKSVGSARPTAPTIIFSKVVPPAPTSSFDLGGKYLTRQSGKAPPASEAQENPAR